MQHRRTLTAAGVSVCVHTHGVDGILHGTEALEQEDVPVRGQAQMWGGTGVSCWKSEQKK